jgi:hypothetical protein
MKLAVVIGAADESKRTWISPAVVLRIAIAVYLMM